MNTMWWPQMLDDWFSFFLLIFRNAKTISRWLLVAPNLSSPVSKLALWSRSFFIVSFLFFCSRPIHFRLAIRWIIRDDNYLSPRNPKSETIISDFPMANRRLMVVSWVFAYKCNFWANFANKLWRWNQAGDLSTVRSGSTLWGYTEESSGYSLIIRKWLERKSCFLSDLVLEGGE